MIIDEKGKISEVIDVQDILPEEESLNNLDDLDYSENISNNSDEIDKQNISDENAHIINKLDTYEEDSQEENDISDNIEDEKNQTAETTCLALTVRKDYNLSIIKNSVIKTFKISLKVTLCTLFLNLLSLFL